MNIIVKPYGSGLCYCRPDTTWERENKDFYSPECVKELHWSPIIFVRISKAGKCIGGKFASRYYDAFNFGALLYCHTSESSDLAYTSCADHTSLLPGPMYNPEIMENEGNVFEVKKNGETIFGLPKTAFAKLRSLENISFKDMIEDGICKASQLTTLRIGDFVAIELTPTSLLASHNEGEASLEATYCENKLLDFKVIF
jgi:hypothetical protein